MKQELEELWIRTSRLRAKLPISNISRAWGNLSPSDRWMIFGALCMIALLVWRISKPALRETAGPTRNGLDVSKKSSGRFSESSSMNTTAIIPVTGRSEASGPLPEEFTLTPGNEPGDLIGSDGAVYTLPSTLGTYELDRDSQERYMLEVRLRNAQRTIDSVILEKAENHVRTKSGRRDDS